MAQSLTEQLKSWLRTKPADEAYEFANVYDCAMGQFGKAVGLLNEGECVGASKAIVHTHIKHCGALRTRPHTFGALLNRLEGEE